jgi:2-C-methyl-D-erythritol 4-phosphate cytidylyltransferase/2-C-methyl-D-erythritol 2,4-cyclodiphosphate synthase
MGAGVAGRKAFLTLGGRTVLERACLALSESERIAGIVVVCHPEDVERTEALLRDCDLGKPTVVVEGGEERTDSVRNGAAVRLAGCEYIAVHDAARPSVSKASLERLFDAAEESGAALLALPVSDTLKRSDGDGAALETVSRRGLWAAQTPQVFPAERFRELLEQAARKDERPTDDAALWERHVGPVRLVEGEAANRKITYPEDLAVAERLLSGGAEKMSLRVGTGFDVHRLVEGRPCILAGVEIPHPSGPAGHSDGDAVLHAVTDAILGAAGMDDLGSLFPDDDPGLEGIASSEFLLRAQEELTRAGWRVVNVDVVIATEGPRIAPHRQEMRASIAGLLGIEVGLVNLKGKSVEGMGALAGGAGIAVQAICLLEGRPVQAGPDGRPEAPILPP